MSEIQRTFVANTQLQAQTLAQGTQARQRAGQVAVGGWLKGIAIRNAKELEDKKMALQHRQLELDRITKNRNYELGLASQRHQAQQVENQRLNGVRTAQYNADMLEATNRGIQNAHERGLASTAATLTAAEKLATAKTSAVTEAQRLKVINDETDVINNIREIEATEAARKEAAAPAAALKQQAIKAKADMDALNVRKHTTALGIMATHEMQNPALKKNPFILLQTIRDLTTLDTDFATKAADKLRGQFAQLNIKYRRRAEVGDLESRSEDKAPEGHVDLKPGYNQLDYIQGTNAAGDAAAVGIWRFRRGVEYTDDNAPIAEVYDTMKLSDVLTVMEKGDPKVARALYLSIAEANGMSGPEAVRRWRAMKEWGDSTGNVPLGGSPDPNQDYTNPAGTIQAAREKLGRGAKLLNVDDPNAIRMFKGDDIFSGNGWPIAAPRNIALGAIEGRFTSPLVTPKGGASATTPADGEPVAGAAGAAAAAQTSLKPMPVVDYSFHYDRLKIPTVEPLRGKQIHPPHYTGPPIYEDAEAGVHIPRSTEAIFSTFEEKSRNIIAGLDISGITDPNMIAHMKRHIVLQGVQGAFQKYLEMLKKEPHAYKAGQKGSYDIEQIVAEIGEVEEILKVLPKILEIVAKRQDLDPNKVQEEWNYNNQNIPEGLLRIDEYSHAKYLAEIFNSANPVYAFHRIFNDVVRGQTYSMESAQPRFTGPGEDVISPTMTLDRRAKEAGRVLVGPIDSDTSHLTTQFGPSAGNQQPADPANWENR